MMLDALAAFVSLTIPTPGERKGGIVAGRFCAPPLSRAAGEGPGVRAGPLTYPPAPFLSHLGGEEGGR
jgi:hypothetical protein